MRILSVALLLSLSALAGAHEVRPAYLRIQDVSQTTGPGRYDVLWRVPTGAAVRLTIFVRLPDHCSTQGEPLAWSEGDVNVARWTSYCPGGLEGHDITIGDLTSSVTDVLARYERTNGTTQVVRLTPTSPGFTVTASETWSQVAATYSLLGVEHILLGFDHLLFVLALLMIVAGWKKLVATVTSFTLAHSMTLAAATLGWVKVSQRPVEAVIALSILFLAVEVVHSRQGKFSLTERAPWIVAFIFGLFHGLGFAGALSEVGLPEHAIPLALFMFNVGVETGQILFVCGVLTVATALRRTPIAWPAGSWRLMPYTIGSLAAFWTIQRMSSFI
ncbi:MAG: HupE/UreJ family protein [Gammaproteobacteria bacterium]|nr:HupE/UreJ family protein [Gammaproteobacteria bacterium]